ncbi:probable peptidyl-tRNA hydrolase 2 isoform X1 [Schistocerca gregaria]|uniref:probable peptidyl-tRNA hydrolase 2 isoform X1 n=1 Tax=Schistocerca gregaria TaxID=7010 RepID=UPI00211E141D|nr:probable peptidyl-tRNA hydrolase 2 isoform X1 [Schistocerca gregaria]
MDGEWKPNEESLQQLLEMGISKEDAEEALRNTGNSSVVFAADYAFAKQDKIDPFLSRVYQIPEGCKMVFVVNTDLGMSIGKTAAQVSRQEPCKKKWKLHTNLVRHGVHFACCIQKGPKDERVDTGAFILVGHATLGLYQKLTASPQYAEDLINWEDNGGKMVVLKGLNYQHLKLLEKEAEVNKLPAHCITDAGLTEVQSGSTTVLAIFGKETQVNNVTGELALLQ